MPVIMVVLGSLKSSNELVDSLSSIFTEDGGKIQWNLFPLYPTLKHYVNLLFETPQFFTVFWNSVKIAVYILGGQILIAVPAAWTFAIYKFRLKRLLFTLYIILMLMPFQVTTQRCESKSLSNELKADGSITEGKERAVVVLEGIRIKEVCVNIGESVDAGAVLFCADLKDLQKLLDTAKENLEVEQSKLSALEESKNQAALTKDTAILRAQQDVETVTAQQNEIVANLQLEYDLAVEAAAVYTSWKDYLKDTDEDNAMTKDEWNTAKQAAEDIVSQKAAALSIGETEKDNAILAANRSLEDAQNADSSTENKGAIAEEESAIDALKKQVADYEAVLADNGKFKSEKRGVVKKINVSAGERTIDGATVILEDGTKGWTFTVNVTKQQQQNISVGDTVLVSFKKENIDIEDAVVESVKENEEGTYDVNVSLRKSKNESGSKENASDNNSWKALAYGMSGVMTITQQSESYDCCVPLSALYADNNKNYVLILREIPSILGTELSAVRVDVDVLDKNEEYAALKGSPVTEKDKLVTSSTKLIKSGDKVRLIEE